MNDDRLEDQVMLIIANAGAARSEAFAALALARKKEFDGAAEGIKAAEQYAYLAHDAHNELLKMDAKGELKQMDLLLSHAQDHLMTATLAMELIGEIILLRQELADNKIL